MRFLNVINCTGVIRQNTLSSIIAPPSGGNSRRQFLKFLAGVTYITSLMSFGVVQAVKNAIIWYKKVITSKTIGQDLLGL